MSGRMAVRAVGVLLALVVASLGVRALAQELPHLDLPLPGRSRVLPDAREGAALGRPLVVRGIALVNAQHPVSADYRPVVGGPEKLTPQARASYRAMVKAASRQGLTIVWRSGYRTIGDQEALWKQSVAQRGSDQETSRYTALPGASEHHTGRAVDVASKTVRGEAFTETPEYAWLRQHAHEYGFILRYPPDKEHITGYAFEPWHYRYIGDAARDFGPQSTLTLEEYLGGR